MWRFNAQGNSLPYDLSKARYKSPVLRGAAGDNVAEISVSLANTRKLVLLVTDAGDGFYHDHADWIDPTLTGPKGTLKLTDLEWTMAKAGWQEVRVGRTVENRPITLKGNAVGGIGTHSASIIEYDVPEGYARFQARGVLSPGSQGKGSVEFMVLTEEARTAVPDRRPIELSFADVGFTGAVRVRDVWAREDIGVFTGSFSRTIPIHGAGLFRLSPVDK